MSTKKVENDAKTSGEETGDEAYYSLVYIDDDSGKFVVNEDALNVLRRLKGEVKVIAVAGMQRTGKSFLLNRLIDFGDLKGNKTDSFEVGSTVQTCTKGINMIVRHNASDDSNVVFLDTEGFGSTVRSQAFDIKLFSLALLLSSYFIYNSRGVIDASAIEDLSLVVQLTRHIHVKELTKGEDDDGTSFSAHFPTFMWVVRDFALKLVDDDGDEIDARKYMENALDSASEEGDSEDAMMVSNMIRGFFTTRDCMTLVRPITDETKLQHLSEQPYESLRSEFREQMIELQSKVVKEARSKTMKGAALSGANLGALVVAYVSAINDGDTPTISTAWERVVEAQCHDALEAAIAVYERSVFESCRSKRMATGDKLASLATTTTEKKDDDVDSDLSVSRLVSIAALSVRSPAKDDSANSREDIPLENSELTASHERASEDARKAFFENFVSMMDGEGAKASSDAFNSKLNDELRDRIRIRRDRNTVASSAFCQRVVDCLFARVEMAEKRLVSEASESAAAKGVADSDKDNFGDDDDEKADDTERAGDDKREAYADPRSCAIQRLVSYHKQTTSSAFAAYSNVARGPAKWSLFARFVSTVSMNPLVLATDAFAHDLAMSTLAQKNVLRERRAEIVRAAQQKVDDAAAFEAERRAFKQQFERLTTDSEAARGRLQSLVDAKTAEVERTWQQNERSARDIRELNEKIEAMRARGAEEASEHRAELSRMRESHRQDLGNANKQLVDAERAAANAKHDALTQKLMLEGRVAELERSLSKLKRESEDMLSDLKLQHKNAIQRERESSVEEARKMVENSGATEAVLKLEAELKDAREHQKLMREHLEVTKDLLKAKNSQVIEVEYQWAAAKAKLAQAQLDREELDADVCVLEDLVTKLKLKAIKTSRDLRSLRLTQKQTQRFYSL
eukprot:g1416.t1